MIEGSGGPGSVPRTNGSGRPKDNGSNGSGSATVLTTNLNSINSCQVLEIAQLQGHQYAPKYIQISYTIVFRNDDLSFLSEKMIFYRQNSYKGSLLCEQSYARSKLLSVKRSSYTEYRQKVSPQCELSYVGPSHFS
jgi:hypothetical protein